MKKKKATTKKRYITDLIGRDVIVGASTVGRLFGDRNDAVVRRSIKTQTKKLRTGTVIQRCSGKTSVVTTAGEAVARDSLKIRSDFKKAFEKWAQVYKWDISNFLKSW